MSTLRAYVTGKFNRGKDAGLTELGLILVAVVVAVAIVIIVLAVMGKF